MDYQEERTAVIRWIVEQLDELPLGLLKIVRGCVRGLMGERK